MESLKLLHCEASVSDNIVASVILESKINRGNLKLSRFIRATKPRTATRIHCHTRPCSEYLSIFFISPWSGSEIVRTFLPDLFAFLLDKICLLLGLASSREKNVADNLMGLLLRSMVCCSPLSPCNIRELSQVPIIHVNLIGDFGFSSSYALFQNDL